MVKLVRIDDRLLHGQVAFAWTNSLGVDAIIVANDEVVNDQIIKMSLKMAVPPDVKLAIRTIDDAIKLIHNPKTENVSIFVVVKNTKDALRLAEGSKLIRKINVGGMRKVDGKDMLTRAVYVDDSDIENLNKMTEIGCEVEIRQVPTDTKKYIYELLK